MQIGVQLFTLREQCTTLEDLENTLKRVAEIGYRYVQVAKVCPYEPAWLKEKLDENGLRCVVTHTSAEQLHADAVAVAKDHDILNCSYVGRASYPFPEKTPDDFAADFKDVARILAENGKRFMLHNHKHEFTKDADGVFFLDRLMQLFPPEQLGVILDTYWVYQVGEDPAAWLRKLSGRVPCIHLKDSTPDGKMAVIGEGVLDWDSIFEAAREAGTEYMLVEQDDCYGEDPFDCLARSYAYLIKRGF